MKKAMKDKIKMLGTGVVGLGGLGAMNMGAVGIMDTNLVEKVLGTGDLATIVYVTIGLGGVAILYGIVVARKK